MMTAGATVPDYANLLRLDERVAIVVGAGQGMGRQTAHALAAVGATVVCVDVAVEFAQHVAEEVGGIAVVADATSVTSVAALIERVRADFGRLDVLVDIVGMARFVPLLETTDEDWAWSFGMNFDHARLLLAHAAPLMIESGGGSVVFIGTISAVTSAPGHAAYGAAKSALLSLVRSAAVELGTGGVRVNAVSPGLTRTPRNSALIDSRTELPTVEPDGRVGEPSDIAGSILFLASGLADHITGQTLLVDGGASVLYAYSPRA